MFLIERQIFIAQKSPETKTSLSALKKSINSNTSRPPPGKNFGSHPAIEKPSSAEDDRHTSLAIYAVTPTYLDIRTPYDEMRGGLFFLALCFLLPPVVIGLPSVFGQMIPELLSGQRIHSAHNLDTPGYITNIFGIFLPFAWIGTGIYFGWRHLRLEAFIQRRIIVRFNRKTRKVYVHRPHYAGGIIELPWDNAIPDGVRPGGDESEGIGASLLLGWLPQHSPRNEFEMLVVGRRVRSNSEITNLWEFIRRYMEEGPEGLPEPQTIGKFPWPWRGLESAWSFIWPVWRIEGLDWARWLIVLMSPLILIFAASHWLALLTCWEPVFPKAIRDACGEGWKDVLRTRMIDVGAWAMLAAVLAGLWQLI